MAPLLVLMMVPMLGLIAVGGEVANWYTMERQMQNAADSSALAAASNANKTTGAQNNGLYSYQTEGLGVAGTYGYVNTAGNADTTVAITNVDCPGANSGTLGCFKSTISRKVPIYLTQLLGYLGNQTRSDGRPGVLVSAQAIASARVHYNFCLMGLSNGGNLNPGNGNGGGNTTTGNISVELNGNGGDFSECAAASAGRIKCTAVTFQYVIGASQQGNTCDNFSPSTATLTDPLSTRTPSIASRITQALTDIPNCLTAWPAVITTNVRVCSSTPAMTQNVTIQQPANGDPITILVYNGTIHTGGHSISTDANSSASFVFTGTGTLPDWFDGDGTVNVTGAIGGNFDDFSLLSDPARATQNFKPGAGSHVVMNAVGTFYAPNTDVQIAGSMSSTVSNRSCIAMIVHSLYVNGGSLDNVPTDCSALGYNQPEVVVARQALVQ